MEEQNLAAVLGALDDCIEKYTKDRKQRVDDFIDHHFSIKETLEIQKKSISRDLFFNPLNALWSIPYLSPILKKSFFCRSKKKSKHLFVNLIKILNS